MRKWTESILVGATVSLIVVSAVVYGNTGEKNSTDYSETPFPATETPTPTPTEQPILTPIATLTPTTTATVEPIPTEIPVEEAVDEVIDEVDDVIDEIDEAIEANDEVIDEAVQEEPIEEPITEEEEASTEASTEVAEEGCTCFESEEVQYGEQHDLTDLGEWTVTAYCSCEICHGEYDGTVTQLGTAPTAGWTCACNTLPLGTIVRINEHEYCVEDTGYTPYGDNWIDIYFDTHEEALEFGVQTWHVYLWE